MKTLILLLLGCQLSAAVQSAPLEPVGTIALAGVKGRFDHFGIDLGRQRLFVAALGNNTLEAIDLKSSTVIKSIGPIRKPSGVLFLPEFDRLFVAAGEDNAVAVFSGSELRKEQILSGYADADNLRYDAGRKLVYVGFGSGALGVIDAGQLKKVSEIPLRGHPESFRLDEQGRCIWVNVPDARHVVVLDRLTGKTLATWPLDKARANFPIAADLAHERLFIGTRQPPQLLVLDSRSGKQIAAIPIHGDTDDLFFDSLRKLIYISCGEGFVDVVEQSGADAYRSVASIPTRPGARTAWFSPELDRFYLAVPERGSDEAEIRVFKTSD